MSIDLERTNLARINLSIAQTNISALSEAAGRYILREEDFVHTLFPFDNYPFNGVISPRFNSSKVDERLEYLLRVVRSPRRIFDSGWVLPQSQLILIKSLSRGD